jgi:hypothetical protein
LQRLFDVDRARDHPAGRLRLTVLAAKMIRTTRRVPTASFALEHLTMISHLLAVPDQVEGVVIECGTFKGGSAANLSLGCALVGRRLHVYDSFAGLPSPSERDREHALISGTESHLYEQGMYTGTLQEVKANIGRYGDLARCSFRMGYFSETLLQLDEPCAMAFVDVDLRDSLEVCVRAIWPRLVPNGSLFVHEAAHREIAGLFFDAAWWQDTFGCEAPGLVGAGSGLGLFPAKGQWTSSLGYAVKEPRPGPSVRQGLSR